MTKPVVYIVIYSLYHHVYKLSLSIKEGLESKGVEVKLFQVPETLSDDILVKMQAPEKLDLPIITVDKLAEPDGILFGLPTRFGTMPAQMKGFLDASGSLWAKGALAGKFVGTFFSTASQHGGQETTALTAVTYFAHHGMLYVPFGFSNPGLNKVDDVVGGSAYGAGTISDGNGSRQPTKDELDIAVNQAVNFAEIVRTFVAGRESTVNTTSVQNKSATVGGGEVPTGTATTTDATGNAIGATPVAPLTTDTSATVLSTTGGSTTADASTTTPSATGSSNAADTKTNAHSLGTKAGALAAGAAGAVAAGTAAISNKTNATTDASQAHASKAADHISSATANVAMTTAATTAAGAENIKKVLASTGDIKNATGINLSKNNTSTTTSAQPAGSASTPSDPTATQTGINAGAQAASATPVVKESLVQGKEKKKKNKACFCM